MKTFAFVIAALMLICGASLYAQQATPVKPSTMPPTSSVGSAGDGEALAYLIAANESEINEAREAQKKATSPAVKEFAAMMIRDHSKNLQDTRKLSSSVNISPEQTAAVQKFRDDDKTDAAVVSKSAGAAFDSAYIDQAV